MIRWLTFDRDGRARWEARSLLPMAAICAVANAARESLRLLYGVPVQLRVAPPVVPSRDAWTVLVGDGAAITAFQGSAAEVCVVIRPRDAAALTAAAFGEASAADRALSPMECEVLERILDRLTGAFAHLCGAEGLRRRPAAPPRAASYFELVVAEPLCARIGVAVAREPRAPDGPALCIEDLGAVEIELAIECAAGAMTLPDVAGLRPGDLVPMTTRVGTAGRLRLGSGYLASVECGDRGLFRACVIR